IFATKPLAKLQIRIRHARLRVSPRNLAAYRSTDGEAGLGYGMVFERAANDRTAAAPTEMMPRLEISGWRWLGRRPISGRRHRRHARQMVQERDHFAISALRGKADVTC